MSRSAKNKENKVSANNFLGGGGKFFQGLIFP